MIHNSDDVADIYKFNRETFFKWLDTFGRKYIIEQKNDRIFLNTWTVDDAVLDFKTSPQIIQA